MKTITAHEIAPPHEVKDAAKFAAIVADMEKNGWTGRPILAVIDPWGQLQALTGSHRIAAAMATSTALPVVVAEVERAWFGSYLQIQMDDGMESSLVEFGCTDPVALELARMENA